MNSYKINGFPTEVSEFVFLPNTAELLLCPMFFNADVDKVRQYGAEIQRVLLDKAPIKNDKKYITVDSFITVLSPEMNSISEYYETNWQIGALNPDTRVHHIISGRDALPLFNSNEVEVSVPEDLSGNNLRKYINKYLNENSEVLGLNPVATETHKFYTFDGSHVYKVQKPKHHEFRFIFRITESNDVAPIATRDPYSTLSFVNGEHGKMANVEHLPNSIFIHNIIPYRFRNN